MRARYRAFFLVSMLALSLFFSPQVQGQNPIGLAISGSLLKASFLVSPGQVINSSLSVHNTGPVPLNVSFDYNTIEGPASQIVVNCPMALEGLPPESTTRVYWSFEINGTNPSKIELTVSGIGLNPENQNPVSIGASAEVLFLPGGIGYSLVVICRDQFQLPFSGLDIELSRNSTHYSTKTSNQSGKAAFLVANGSYNLRVTKSGIVKRQLDVLVLEDRELFLTIQRDIPKEEPATFHLVELVLGLFLGYVIRYFEKGRTRNKLEELLEWIRKKREAPGYFEP